MGHDVPEIAHSSSSCSLASSATCGSSHSNGLVVRALYSKRLRIYSALPEIFGLGHRGHSRGFKGSPQAGGVRSVPGRRNGVVNHASHGGNKSRAGAARCGQSHEWNVVFRKEVDAAGAASKDADFPIAVMSET